MVLKSVVNKGVKRWLHDPYTHTCTHIAHGSHFKGKGLFKTFQFTLQKFQRILLILELKHSVMTVYDDSVLSRQMWQCTHDCLPCVCMCVREFVCLKADCLPGEFWELWPKRAIWEL